MKDGEKINYIPDNPISLEAHDILGTKIYVDTIQKVLENCNPPYTIGLFGSWGSGKSSIVKTLQERNEEKIFIYDAWKYNNDDFRRTFILQLRKKFGLDTIDEEEIFYKDKTSDISIRPKINKSFFIILGVTSMLTFLINLFFLKSNLPESIIGSLSLGGLFSLIFSILSQGVIYYRTTLTTSKLFAPEKFEEIFKKTIKEINSKKNLQRIIIAIDNIDRCSKEQLLEILMSVKTFLENEHVIFIIPIDDNGLKKHLGMPTYEANEYIRKIFNMSILIKNYTSNELFDYAIKLCKKHKIDIPKKDIVLSIITQEFTKNPRKIIQFINTFQTEYHLADEQERQNLVPKGSVTGNIEMFTKLLIIREEYPELYSKIVDDKSFLKDITNYIKNEIYKEKDENEKKFQFGGVQISEDLYRFLLRTSNIVLDSQSLEPFLVIKDLFKDVPDEIYYELLSQDWIKLKNRIDKKEIDLNSLIKFVDKIVDEEVVKKQSYKTTGYNSVSLIVKIIKDEKDNISFSSSKNILALFEKKEIWENTFDYPSEELCISLKWLKEKYNFKLDTFIDSIKSLETKKEIEEKHINLIKAYINIFDPDELKKISEAFTKITSNNFDLYKNFKNEINSEKIQYLLTDEFARKIIPTLQIDPKQNLTIEKVDILKSLQKHKILSQETDNILIDKIVEHYKNSTLPGFTYWAGVCCDFIPNVNIDKQTIEKISKILSQKYQQIFGLYYGNQFQQQYINAYETLLRLMGELFLKIEDENIRNDVGNKIIKFFDYNRNHKIASFINDDILQKRIIPNTQTGIFIPKLISNFIQQGDNEVKKQLFQTIQMLLMKKDINFLTYQDNIKDLIIHLINLSSPDSEIWLEKLATNSVCLKEMVKNIHIVISNKSNLINKLLQITQDADKNNIKKELFDLIKADLADKDKNKISGGLELLHNIADRFLKILSKDEKETIRGLLKSISQPLSDEDNRIKDELLKKIKKK